MTKESETIVNENGIGFLGLLTVLFIGLKLTGYIAWSWLWVLSPLWIPIAFVISFMILGAIVIGLAYIIAQIVHKINKG